MRWGTWGANYTTTELKSLINGCLENGLYTFDHADIYGNYTTEKQFGDALKEMQLDRNAYQLISKCGIELPGGEAPFTLKAYNYSEDYILKSVEKSLQNLRTEYLDLFLLHRPSPLLDPEIIASAFTKLKDQGKVKNFGVSNFSKSQVDLVSTYFPDLLTNQIEISVNQIQSFYDGTLDQMMIRKMTPTAWSVMGTYFTEPETEQNKRIKRVFSDLQEKYQASESQLILAFLLKHPAKTVPIIGSTKLANILDAKKALELDLDRKDWFLILEAIQGNEVP